MTFLLYEIQFGNDSYVDELIMKRIRTEPVEKVLVLIIQEATKISPSAARSVLRRMIQYKIDHDVAKRVLSANIDFEMKNGDAASITEVKVLQQQFLMREKHKEVAKPKVTPIVTPNVKPIIKPATLVVKQVTSVAKPEILVWRQITPAVKPVTPAKKPLYLENSKEFRTFRLGLLKPLGIHSDEIDDVDVRAVEVYTGTGSGLIKLCEATLEKHKKRFAIVKIICKKYWEMKMFVHVRELLTKAKDNCDESLLKNLVVLYEIKSSILKGSNIKEIVKNLVSHINAATTVQMLNFFEDLTNENCIQISKIFVDCLNDSTVSLENKKVISLEFKDFALKFGNDMVTKRANGYVNKFNWHFSSYHCEKQLEKNERRPLPIKNSSNEQTICNDIKAYLAMGKMKNVLGCYVLVLRTLYIYDYWKLARDYRDTFYENLYKQHKAIAFQFSLLSAMMESKYADKQQALKWLDAVPKTYIHDMNYICVRVDCLISQKDLQGARDLLASYIQDPFIMMHPEVQKLLFLCSHDWKVKYNVELLDDLLPKQQ